MCCTSLSSHFVIFSQQLFIVENHLSFERNLGHFSARVHRHIVPILTPWTQMRCFEIVLRKLDQDVGLSEFLDGFSCDEFPVVHLIEYVIIHVLFLLLICALLQRKLFVPFIIQRHHLNFGLSLPPETTYDLLLSTLMTPV